MADTTIAQTIYEALLFAGATPVQAAGIMGNMVQESSLDPEDNAPGNWGLVQWTIPGAGSGIDRNQYITGNTIHDIEAQIELLKQQGGFAAASGSTAEEAAVNFMNNYERPDAALANEARRTSAATSIFQVAQSGGWAGLSFGNSPATGSPGATPQGADNTSGNIPGLNDIPGLVAYIQQNFPDWAWMLNIPEVGQIIEDAVAAGQGGNTNYIQAKIQGTEWWKTTSANMRAYEQNLFTYPGDYQFTTPGSKAAQEFADVVNQSATIGVQLTVQEAQTVALEALQYGWDTNQIQARIGAFANQGNAQAVVSKLQSDQGQYLIPISPAVMNSWVQNIAEGKQSEQQWQAYLKQQAALKWTGMAPQLDQGYTPLQIVSGLQDNAAQIMETSPQNIDFINNPQYAKILDFRAPGDQQARLMTQSEESQYLKSLPQYGYTQGARDSVSNLANTITQTFGKIGQGL